MQIKMVELSEIQKGIYFECQTGGKFIYNVPEVMTINSPIVLSKLQQSLELLVKEQVVLRSYIQLSDGKLMMVVNDRVDTVIHNYDLSDERSQERRINDIIDKEMRYEFDLLRPPFFRVSLVKKDEEHHIIVINVHHIIADGVSLNLLLNKLFTYYLSLLKGEAINVEEDYRFLNFVAAENKKLLEGKYENQREYWQGVVKDTQVLDFPKDFSGTQNNFGMGKIKRFPISKELMKRIKLASAEEEVTSFIFCFSVFQVLMRKYCNQENVVISSPFTYRPGYDLADTIGCYIYTLPLIGRFKGQQTFKEFLTEMCGVIIKARMNLGYPNNLIAREFESGVYSGMQSMFDISFVYDIFNDTGWEELRCKEYDSDQITFPGNMMVILCDMLDEDMIKIQYKPDIYSEQIIEFLGKRFIKILDVLTRNTEVKIDDLNFFIEREAEQIVCDFNQSSYFEYSPRHIIDIFNDKMKSCRDQIALIYDGGSMTYEEVDKATNQIANHILRFKKQPNEIIGVQLRRSKEMVLAILGILKSGCAYVPIEIYYPQARKEYILGDAAISILITASDLSTSFCKEQTVVLVDQNAVYTESDSCPEIELDPYDLAYVEYTSGSTGVPKGVMIENHSVVNTVLDLERRFPVEENDIYLYKTPFSFDISGTELYGWFAGKGALCILADEGEKNPELILEYIDRYQVTHINFVPTMFRMFLGLFQNSKNIEKLKSLKWIFIGGEAVTTDIIDKFFSLNLDVKLENVYGPTECTMWASHYSIAKPEDVANVSIGRPLNEIRWYVVDSNNNLQMIGVPGELCLSGVGLARGYLNKDELTKERFCPNPFYQAEKDPFWFKKMYRTGDLARWLPDGTIEFMGRIDFQVKISGVRIELGEIEHALEEHALIDKAVVVTKKTSSQLPILCAYYQGREELPALELREFLSKHISAYMIPSFFVSLEEFPVNSNGKTDINALMNDTSYKSQSKRIYQKPETELEKIIVNVWKNVLEIQEIGLDDDFFEIGGHSMAAILVHDKLKSVLKREFSITSLFRFPTLRLLSGHLTTGQDIGIADRESCFKRKEKPVCYDIAIIGMAIDVPGAEAVNDFWYNLKNGTESIYYYSDEELRELGISEDAVNDRNYVKAKGRVNDIDCFDSDFFEYTPKDVESMSPQLRLLYKGTWEALEDAGYYPGPTSDAMGIFIGGSDDFQWYKDIFDPAHNFSDIYQAYTMSTNHFLASRLAYRFNIRGPVFSTLTGCSTTLVTPHLACQSLILGECDIAIAGGITVELPNDGGYMYYEGMMFSPDGHCRPFDADAKGTVFSNGMGIVILKRLDEALAAGDHIYAVIKGSAINNDGNQKTGFAAPSVDGQAEVIRKAYQNAEIDPETIGYVEAHGTGTILGDPIEVESLTKAFATDKKQYCVLGSVKGNIGHTDTAAGVVGLIKAALSLEHKYIPATINYHTPNPKIDFTKIPFIVSGEGQLWTRKDNLPLRAGINSFGVGGTNAHMVLEEAPVPRVSSAEEPCNLLLFSAKTELALQRNIKASLSYLAADNKINRSDAAWTLMSGRKPFKYRKSVVVNQELGRTLDIDEALEEILDSGSKKTASNNKIYFMFSGQGSQYQGIGWELYNSADSEIGKQYRAHIDKILGYLSADEKTEFFDVIFGNADPLIINQTKYSQFALFMTEYALASIMMDMGVKPDGFIGHSIGEVTAAAIAGVWSLADAVKIIRMRAELMQKQKPGTMLAIMAEAEVVEKMLIDGVSLSLNNSSDRCVVGGTKEKIELFEKNLAEKGIKATILRTSHAFHTEMMAGAASEFKEYLKAFEMSEPDIPIVSNISGDWVCENEMTTPDYWAQHLIKPVRFDKSLELLLTDENAVFLEIGAGRSLCTFALQHKDKKESQTFINMLRHPREKQHDLEYLYSKIGLAWCSGIEFEWNSFIGEKVRNRIPLPVYQFEKIPYPIKMIPEGSTAEITKSKVSPEVQQAAVTFDTYESLESSVIESFKTVLGFKDIANDQDFFELGGDSLKAVSLSNVLAGKTGIKVTITDVFNNSTPKKLKTLLDSIKKPDSDYKKIALVGKSAYYEVTSAQKRMFGLYQLDKANLAYNLPSATIIEGVLDENRVRETMIKLLERHASLRTSFEIRDNQIVQIIADKAEMDVTFETRDFENIEQLDELIDSFVRPFDLSKAPLCRLKIVTFGNKKTVFLFDAHHIVADGSSMEIITEDINQLYKGTQGTLEPLEIQYKDFAAWQNQYLKSAAVDELREYWVSRFKGEVPVLELPLDKERPSVKTYHGSRLYFNMDDGLVKQLKQFSGEHGVTMYMTLLSAWYVLLSRYSGQEDIVIGSPVVGRTNEQVMNISGMFINMLAMRNQPLAGKSFVEFLGEVKDNTLKALKYQDYQFDDLIHDLDIKWKFDRNALFDVCFDYQNMPVYDIDFDGLKATSYEFNTHNAAYDLVLTCQQRQSDSLECFIDFSMDLFHEATIERMMKNYQEVLSDILKSSTKSLGEITILSEDEKNMISRQFTDTKLNVDQTGLIHELFERRVEEEPDKTVLVTADGREFSYYDLNQLANRIARKLISCEVGPGDFIGLMTKRDECLLAGMLGILKSGAAYIPIDFGFPKERIRYMLDASKPKVILIDKEYQDKLDYDGQCIDCGDLMNSQEMLNNPGRNMAGNPLAYMIFTSGSTGNPKGVMVNHSAVVNFINDTINRNIFATQQDRIICVTTLSFDIFAFESIVPVCTGHSIYMADETEQLDPAQVAEKIVKHNVTHILSTVSRIKAFVDNKAFDPALKQLKCILSGGENYPVQMLKDIRGKSQARIFNMYGPTETTIWSTVKDLTESDSITIGKPIANTQIFILNSSARQQPIGVYGEICIAGHGLAAGYYDNPEETEKKFILWGDEPCVKLYKTGDRGRMLSDGEVEISGRLDNQVKVRGYRIELGEIEKVALAHQSIANAVVTVIQEGDQNKDLALFYCLKDDAALTAREDDSWVKAWLAAKLPQYMVPSEYVSLKQMPVLPNGKLDKKALTAVKQISLTESKVSPKSELEEKLLNIWKEILHKTDIGIRDNFFDAGGNSLSLMLVNNKLTNDLGLTVPIMKLFEFPTIEALVLYIRSESDHSNGNWEVDDFDDDGFDDLISDTADDDEQSAKDIKRDDIAVIGMACRFPDAENIEEFWQNILDGKESIRTFSNQELLDSGVPEEIFQRENYIRAKGYLDGAEYFDAKLFDYSGKEAQLMDPQIRLLHQCTYEVLENAGYDSFTYEGRIGMFAGCSSNVLWMNKIGLNPNDIMEGFEAITYNERDFLTTRIAYKLNLKGPSISVQTACSTSLVAIHQAAAAIMSGEADMAVAGGVSISYPRKEGYLWNEGMIFSRDGHCRPFSDDSSGTVPGNGCGVVLLKSLKQARKDKDHIYAVIKGTAVNNDGINKIGFTAPSIKGQSEVIKAALTQADVNPEEICYLETHGTGTELGDPIEIEALKQAWNASCLEKKEYCALGAVKANIGHLDAAAGVAGFIKTVLVLDQKKIPPMINFHEPNEKINLADSPFYIETKARKLESGQCKLKAAVSSFGIGGTNAHIILEEVGV